MGPARLGSVMATAGKVLLWMDLIPLAFVYVSVRDGSYFWVYWTVAQAIVGFALLAFGVRKRAMEIERSSRKRAA